MNSFRKRFNSTFLLTGLTAGLALLLFAIAFPIAEGLNKQFRIDDDWAWLALPTGGFAGLIVGVWKRQRKWMKVSGGLLLVLLAATIVWLSIPIEAPETVPEGMNRLHYGLGNMVRLALLYTALITTVVSFTLAVVVNAIVAVVERLRAGSRGFDSAAHRRPA